MSDQSKLANRYDELSFRAVDHPSAPMLTREWLRLVRERQGLRQMDVATRLAALGPQAALSREHLSKLERGKSSFSSLGFFQTDGVRQVLNVAQAEWDERMQQVSVPLQRRAP